MGPPVERSRPVPLTGLLGLAWFIQLLVESVRHAGSIQYNAHAPARSLLSRMIHDAGYRSVLAGEGADEVFAPDLTRLLDRLIGREPVRQSLYGWLRSIFVNCHLAAERLDMAHGVEVRLPFLDHVLFERIGRLPVSALTRNGTAKHLLREAARSYVTDAVHRGEKKPFLAPPSGVRAAIALLDRLPGMAAGERATVDPILMLVASLVVLQERYQL